MSEFKDLKVKMHLSIGYSQASRSDEVYLSEWVDEDSWNEMSKSAKVLFVDDRINDWANNYIDIGGGVEE